MRSTQLDLKSYDTDKIAHKYLARYDPLFAPLVDQPVNLLELGVFRGGSVRLWRDYFPNGKVVGVDLNVPPGLENEPRITLYQGSQDDAALLNRIAAEHAPGGFDVVIDDASHIGTLTKASFDILFDRHLKAGGWYVIEDWPTGYLEDWHDGVAPRATPSRRERLARWLLGVRTPPLKRPWPTHSYGLVGFVKDLIDEQAAATATCRVLGGVPLRDTRFESMLVTPTILFIKKRSDAPGG